MYVLTKRHERKFWDAVMESVARLRVVDWTIRKQVAQREESDPSCMADCASSSVDRVATITLYREWEREPTDQELREVAFHEVLHIVLSPLMLLAGERYVSEKQLEDAEHEVIRQVISFTFRKGTTSE